MKNFGWYIIKAACFTLFYTKNGFFDPKQRNVLIKKGINRHIALIIIGSYMQILKVYIIDIKKGAKIGFLLI